MNGPGAIALALSGSRGPGGTTSCQGRSESLSLTLAADSVLWVQWVWLTAMLPASVRQVS
jgi:hypothetical protein